MLFSVRRIQSAFEISFANRPASGGPAFLAPIRGEAIVHQHGLYAWIAQHRVAGGFAAVKIGKGISFNDRPMSLDVCVVAIDVLPRDQEVASFILWRIRDRRAYFRRVHARFSQRPRQQLLRKSRIFWPATYDFRERGTGLISSTAGERVLEQPEPAS